MAISICVKSVKKKYGKEYRLKKKKNANNNIEYID